MATEGKTGAQARPKSIKELDRAPMVSLKTKKTKRISRGKQQPRSGCRGLEVVAR